MLHSQPKSTVGTPAYIAPEVLSRKEYDGKASFFDPCSQRKLGLRLICYVFFLKIPKLSVLIRLPTFGPVE